MVEYDLIVLVGASLIRRYVRFAQEQADPRRGIGSRAAIGKKRIAQVAGESIKPALARMLERPKQSAQARVDKATDIAYASAPEKFMQSIERIRLLAGARGSRAGLITASVRAS